LPYKTLEARRAAYALRASIKNENRRKRWSLDLDFRNKVNIQNREFYSKNKEDIIQKKRTYRLNRYYGITNQDYIQMLNKQKGVCALCGKAETYKLQGKIRALAVDHNNKTKQVRQLLCVRCNTTLGLCGESTMLLIKSIFYLLKHRVRNAF